MSYAQGKNLYSLTQLTRQNATEGVAESALPSCSILVIYFYILNE